MATKLEAHEQPISRIFSNDYVFKIPAYQRPYAWTVEQARELFDDLLGFMNSRPGDIEDMPPYFLGSIVLIKKENLPDCEVIDGQQRLTTLTILLSAIRASVTGNNVEDITQLIYEKGSQILGTQDRFRLTLRDRDLEFFQKYIQREGGFAQILEGLSPNSDSQKNIVQNARYIHGQLASLPIADRLRLAQFAVTRCYLVAVATPDINSAYRIFSVLNTRGLDLSATDILKAEIIGGIPAAQRDLYTMKWEDTEEDLGREAFGELFSHIRMIYRKAKPHGTLLAEFKEHVTKEMEPRYFIDEVLLPTAEAFEELSDEVYSGIKNAEPINNHLKWLNRLEFNDWMPPALAFSIRNRNDPDAMLHFFRDLERLAYSLLITKVGINERVDRFSKLTKMIENGDNLYLQSSPLELSPTEQYETFNVLAGPLYELLYARARSLILLRLDSLVSGGGATYDFATITVEHVLPQNPKAGSQWLSWFPDIEIRANLVHSIGNLVLLTRKKNSSASNYEFERKKNSYFTRGGVSPFPLTTQVIAHPTWTPEIINKRQHELLSLFEIHWCLGDRSNPQVDAKVTNTLRNDSTWKDDVYEALRHIGGRGSLHSIYVQVETLRRAAGRSVPQSLAAITRRVLEENSTDSQSYRGGTDLFKMAGKKGSGLWAIRS